MAWGWIALLLGIVYGYAKPGRQDKMKILKTGVIIGVLLALVFAVVGFAVPDLDPLGFGMGGILGTLIAFVVLTVVFIVGVFIGDWLEGLRTPRRA